MSATPKMENDEKMTTTTATESAVPELEMPGFRFHPTEEELLDFYLKHMVFGKKMRFDIIGFLNIYHHDPWDLPGLAKIGEREWYFYVPMDRKHGHGGRPNRTTEHGFWKATGSDRTIRSIENPKRIIGLRKTLVFYTGRAPRGCKTDWVMNEYRLPLTCKTLPKEDIVLCKIYRKATSLKVLEQRAAMEEETKSSSTSHTMFSSPSRSTVSDDLTVTNFGEEQNIMETLLAESNDMVLKAENEEEQQKQFQRQEENMTVIKPSPSLLRTGLGDKEHLPVLQLPKINLDWTQDQFWTQLHSPWLDNWLIHANVL